MTILDRLKLELSNKNYFTDDEYKVFLEENDFLDPEQKYNKKTMQRSLLYTVIDVLEAISNDTDLMRKIQGEFATVGEATRRIQERIEKTKKRILLLPKEASDDSSNFSLLYTKQH